jgi:hypothetical protein
MKQPENVPLLMPSVQANKIPSKIPLAKQCRKTNNIISKINLPTNNLFIWFAS